MNVGGARVPPISIVLVTISFAVFTIRAGLIAMKAV